MYWDLTIYTDLIWRITIDICHLTFTCWHLPFDIYHLTFKIWNFYVIWHLQFDIYHLTFNIWNVTFDICNLTLTFYIYCLTFDLKKAFGQLQYGSTEVLAHLKIKKLFWWSRIEGSQHPITQYCKICPFSLADFHLGSRNWEFRKSVFPSSSPLFDPSPQPRLYQNWVGLQIFSSSTSSKIPASNLCRIQDALSEFAAKFVEKLDWVEILVRGRDPIWKANFIWL